MLAPPHTRLTHLWVRLSISVSVGLGSFCFLPTALFSSEIASFFRQTDKHNHLFLLFFLPFNYLRQKMGTFEVELNIAAVFFWRYWCYNNKSSSLRCYSATCCWGKINNCIYYFTPSLHRKPSNYSAFFSLVLLDLCMRLCSATAGFGPKTLQELMGNSERIYIGGLFQVWTEQ